MIREAEFPEAALHGHACVVHRPAFRVAAERGVRVVVGERCKNGGGHHGCWRSARWKKPHKIHSSRQAIRMNVRAMLRFIETVYEKLKRHPKRIVFPEGSEPADRKSVV